MNGVAKPFRKQSDHKNHNNSLKKVKLQHVNKKRQARNPIFVKTWFSHSNLKSD